MRGLIFLKEGMLSPTQVGFTIVFLVVDALHFLLFY